MKYYIMPHDDIRMNLATEEYVMNHVDVSEPLLLFYIQKPCVIIGRNQNAYEEVDTVYLKKHNIQLTRRISGGGTVYDDLGNVSFSFVTKREATVFGDYQGVTTPILQALKRMGAMEATAGGRNDLFIEGKKFSGNAMYTKKDRTYSHGTLMYDVDLIEMEQVLLRSKSHIHSQATPSVHQQVTNLKPHLSKEYQFDTTEEFRDALLCQLYQISSLTDIRHQQLILSAADEAAIKRLFQKRYGNQEWIYGEAPVFQFHQKTRVPAVGVVDIGLSIEKGRIASIKILGDYFGQLDIAELEKQLLGQLYEYNHLEQLLSTVNVGKYISRFSAEELLRLLFQ